MSLAESPIEHLLHLGKGSKRSFSGKTSLFELKTSEAICLLCSQGPEDSLDIRCWV